MVAGLRSAVSAHNATGGAAGGVIQAGAGAAGVAGRAAAAAGGAGGRMAASIARQGFAPVRTAAYKLAALRGRT
jgi:type IV secretion system protein VirB6